MSGYFLSCQGEIFDNQGILTVSGCPKLPVAANGPVGGPEDDFEMVCYVYSNALSMWICI